MVAEIVAKAGQILYGPKYRLTNHRANESAQNTQE